MPQPLTSTSPTSFASVGNVPDAVMIGDFFGSLSSQRINIYDPIMTDVLIDSTVAPVIPGAAVGRVKWSESNSPIPQDRLLFNYSYFDNVPLTDEGVNVNRFSPGFEKTFFGGAASVEVRVPFASTVESDLFLFDSTNTSEVELGNLVVSTKALLYDTGTFAVATGLGLALPTAQDVEVKAGDITVAEVRNRSVHLLPYIATVYTPTDRLFAMTNLQFDVDANGNPVYVTGQRGTPDPTADLARAGTLDDTTFVYVDMSIGYWVYLADCPKSGCGINGIAPTLELHWNRTVEDSDSVRFGVLEIGGQTGRIDVWNIVLGANVLLGQDKRLLLAYTTAAGSGSDRQFDGELRVHFDWRFGGARNTRSRRPLF